MQGRFGVRTIGVLLLGVCVWGAAACGGGADVEELLEGIGARIEAVDSLTADIVIQMQMMGREMRSSGTWTFRKPDQSRMEMETEMGGMKMKQLTVSDGATQWTYQPMMNLVQKLDMAEIKEAMKEVASAPGDLNEMIHPLGNLSKGSVTWLRMDEQEGVRVNVFEGVPDVPAQAPQMPFLPVRVEVWIGAEDGLPRRVVLFDEDGHDMMTQRYSNLSINPDLPADRFEFTVPEGAQVMDMTQATLHMLRSMREDE